MQVFERILIADDDNDDIELLSECLSNVVATKEIITASNGKELLNYLLPLENLPGLIFLDINMPLKNGIECLQTIHEVQTLQHIPIVVFSTSHRYKDIDACYNLGAWYYMIKPIHRTSLLKQLSHLFEVLGQCQPANKNAFLLADDMD